MPPRLSEAEIEKLRVLYEDSPLSVLALIRETGHSHRTIYYYAVRRGWKSRAARRGPRLPRAEIRTLYEDTIVPVAEIARLAGVAVPTIHVWAVRGGWKPRASRLRGEGARRGGEIADLKAEVAAARRRAEDVQEERAQEARLQYLNTLLREAKQMEREQNIRAAAAKPKRSRRRVWRSPEERAAEYEARERRRAEF